MLSDKDDDACHEFILFDPNVCNFKLDKGTCAMLSPFSSENVCFISV